MEGKMEFGRGRMPGELLKKWPRGEDGEPVRVKFLKHCTCVDMDDKLTVNMLEAYGIPAVTMHPGDGDFGKLMLGMSGLGTDIYVPETMYDDAAALMEAEPDDELQS